jgi:small GTP-binding protein
MIKKKVSMIGSFAVGKTSLVQQYVNSIFSDKYMTTIGVKIDQKLVSFEGQEVNLILWDIHGKDEFQEIKTSYLIGSAGYFLVLDGTRKKTLEIALELHEVASKATSNAPFVVLINKSDLKDNWEINDSDINELKTKGWIVLETSAKENHSVEEAFELLTGLMLK